MNQIPSFIDPDTLFPHDSDRFVDFYDYCEDGKQGFKLQDGSKFIYLSNNGWIDENGCCYDAEGTPDGWFIYSEDNKEKYYYDFNGHFMPADEDPSKLPKHKTNYKKGNADQYGCYLEDNGCYYDSQGQPLGWKIPKAGGKLYFFDLDGQYIQHIEAEQEEKNDLIDFDLGDFIKDYRTMTWNLKQTQKQYPKQQMQKQQIQKSAVIIEQQQKQQEQVQLNVMPNLNQIPQMPAKQVTNKQQQNQKPSNTSNSNIIYHFLLPKDDTNTLKQQFINFIKGKLDGCEPKFMANNDIITVKCDKPLEFLEQNTVIFGDNIRAIKQK